LRKARERVDAASSAERWVRSRMVGGRLEGTGMREGGGIPLKSCATGGNR
jgi:hypothetical protein